MCKPTVLATLIGLALPLALGAMPGCSCNHINNQKSVDGGEQDQGAPIDSGGGDTAMSMTMDGGDMAMVLPGDGGDGSIGPMCFGAGTTCTVASDCCSRICDGTSHVCVDVQCGMAGASCASALDCCGLACVGNLCSATMKCVSDNQSCTSSSSCCSTVCGASSDGGMTCTPLNTMCKTAGNACTMNSDCCNGLCKNNQCAAPSQVSYCHQVGDICKLDADCCTGVCNLVSGSTVGTCAAITTSQNCEVDGTVCNGCGVCCSHFCGPFGSSGSSICQPTSGCHVQGDTCRTSKDCCGGDSSTGLPGAGQVACVPDPTYPTKIGTCSPPNKTNCPTPGLPTCMNTCDPAGDICHFTMTAVCQGSTTNVRDDCCACISSKTCCKPDATGIPRCNLTSACVAVGGICSFSGDCCNNEPCVPDTTGTLRCGSMCSQQSGTCTTNADCCTGLLCVVPPGSLQGSCTNPNPPPADMSGTADMAGVDLAGVDSAPPLCAQYGQSCSTTVPCCNGVGCLTPSASGSQPCPTGATDCVCYSTIIF